MTFDQSRVPEPPGELTQRLQQEIIDIAKRNPNEKFLRASVTYLLALERTLHKH